VSETWESGRPPVPVTRSWSPRRLALELVSILSLLPADTTSMHGDASSARSRSAGHLRHGGSAVKLHYVVQAFGNPILNVKLKAQVRFAGVRGQERHNPGAASPTFSNACRCFIEVMVATSIPRPQWHAHSGCRSRQQTALRP
jgi:hypothetical protein